VAAGIGRQQSVIGKSTVMVTDLLALMKRLNSAQRAPSAWNRCPQIADALTGH
jgi:hypothetical protein